MSITVNFKPVHQRTMFCPSSVSFCNQGNNLGSAGEGSIIFLSHTHAHASSPLTLAAVEAVGVLYAHKIYAAAGVEL